MSNDKVIDELVQQAIAAARRRKPGCGVREAAEMTAGRPLSEDEWLRKGPIWLRNWVPEGEGARSVVRDDADRLVGSAADEGGPGGRDAPSGRMTLRRSRAVIALRRRLRAAA